MRTDSLFYRLSYRFAKANWVTGEPRPELKEIVSARKPGRVLDLGCGTGDNAIFLAKQGWKVVGVDYVPKAIEIAKDRARSAQSSVDFRVADVSSLRGAGVTGPFDLLVYVGCYHGIPTSIRDAYAAEVAAVAGPGADLYIVGVSSPPAIWRLIGASGLPADDVPRRFGSAFEVIDQRAVGAMGRLSQLLLYHLVRKPSAKVTDEESVLPIGRRG
jgi:SAM-dependent methyltransferase